MKQFARPAAGRFDGQETASTRDGLQVSDCTGSARRQQDDQADSQLSNDGRRALRALFGAGPIHLDALQRPRLVIQGLGLTIVVTPSRHYR